MSLSQQPRHEAVTPEALDRAVRFQRALEIDVTELQLMEEPFVDLAGRLNVIERRLDMIESALRHTE